MGRHQRVYSINALVSCWSTSWRQQRFDSNVHFNFALTLNWPREKSIATIVIHKLSICKIHWKQLNTRLLVENRTCKLIIRSKLERSTLCFHWKYSFPCNFNFCAGLGSCCHPSDLAGGRSGGPIGTAQQDFLILLFFRFPWVGSDRAHYYHYYPL